MAVGCHNEFWTGGNWARTWRGSKVYTGGYDKEGREARLGSYGVRYDDGRGLKVDIEGREGDWDVI